MTDDAFAVHVGIDLVGDAPKVKATLVPIWDASVPPVFDFTRVHDDIVNLQSHIVPVSWQLPAVLAGPIVRRAEDTGVYLWICTSTSAKIDATVFTASPEQALGKGSTTTTAFGTHVHAALVYVTPVQGRFPRDVILSYTMRLTATGGGFFGDVAFLTRELAYGSAKFPSFILPSDSAPIVLIQGSCRKLHGGGADALTQGDAYMSGVATQVSQRPQQMLFTGDQIYGDDVGDGVLVIAKSLGPYLVGFDEMMPLDKPTPASTIATGKGSTQRGGLVRAAGFTSDEDSCKNHAMAFSEYMTLYLLAWSGDVWNLASKNYSKLVSGGSLDAVRVDPRAAQRLMANVPTYMMCDDHEVTDDWFIDRRVFEATTTKPLLSRIALNALGNYWLFQAWGNSPAAFGGRGGDLSSHLLHSAPPRADTLVAQFVGTFAGGVIGRGYSWAFVTPPPASVVMMDTRTRRVLGAAETPPGLLNDDALAVVGAGIAASPADRPVIVVSPPPVFGYDGFEFLQSLDVVLRSGKFYEDDFETWAANVPTFFSFLKMIANSGRRKVVFFAGDVHYAFANSVAYCVLPARSVEVLHLTSSSLKNKMDAGQSRKSLVPEVLNSYDSKNIGFRNGDKYSQVGQAELEVMMAAVFPATAVFDNLLANANVYINWHFHDVQSTGSVIKNNNLGIFTMNHGQDPTITNVYIDESGGRHTTSGSWSQLMRAVQPSTLQKNWVR